MSFIFLFGFILLLIICMRTCVWVPREARSPVAGVTGGHLTQVQELNSGPLEEQHLLLSH